MDQTQLASFKYKHQGRTRLSGKRKLFILVSLILSPIVAFATFPGGLLFFAVPLGAFLFRQSTLSIGPRYLICGEQIIYYANVTGLDLSEAEGILTLSLAGGKRFAIEREKFPTNARKTPKIAANKAAKFKKVTSKIIEKVRRLSPAFSGT